MSVVGVPRLAAVEEFRGGCHRLRCPDGVLGLLCPPPRLSVRTDTLGARWSSPLCIGLIVLLRVRCPQAVNEARRGDFVGGVGWAVVGEGFTVGHGSVSQLAISLACGVGQRPAAGVCAADCVSRGFGVAVVPRRSEFLLDGVDQVLRNAGPLGSLDDAGPVFGRRPLRWSVVVGGAERMRRFGWRQRVWCFELAAVVALPTVRKRAQFRPETAPGSVCAALGQNVPLA